MYKKQKLSFKTVKKSVCAILASLMVSTFCCPSSVCAVNSGASLAISDNRSFSEKHPTLYKCLVYFAKAAAITGAAIGTYYLGGLALDKLYPERVTDRQNEKIIDDVRRTKSAEMIPLLIQENLNDDDKVKLDNLKRQIEGASLLKSQKGGDDSFKYIKRTVGIGGLIALLDVSVNVLNQAGKAAESTMYLSVIPFAYKRFENVINGVKDLFKTPPKFLTKQQIFSNFDKLFCNLEGQENAKKEISNFVYDNVLAKDEARWSRKKYNHGDILYFYGPSGVGKSLAASYLPFVFSPNSRVFVLSSADVDKEKKESVISQIFTPSSSNGNTQSNRFNDTKKSELVEFIKNNPGGFVKIEEYDKLCTPALDEIFRTIADTGIINVNGEKIDCSGITFILTSNEDDVSMEGFDKDDAQKMTKKNRKDGYTRVWHDKSFLNRVRKVKFNNLTSKEYKIILKKSFNDKFMYWKDVNNGGVELSIDDVSIEKLASKVENTHRGARPIYLSILPEFQAEMVKKIQSAPNFDFYKNKKLFISYDDKSDKILINEKE